MVVSEHKGNGEVNTRMDGTLGDLTLEFTSLLEAIPEALKGTKTYTDVLFVQTV